MRPLVSIPNKPAGKATQNAPPVLDDQSVEFHLIGQLTVLEGHPTRIVEGVLIGLGGIQESLTGLGCRMPCELGDQYCLHSIFLVRHS